MADKTRNRVSAIEQSILDTEQLLGINITIHDLGGIFHDPQGMPLLGARRQSHRRFPLCARVFDIKCRRHCGRWVTEKAARADAPFTHSCSKGMKEIVVPLKRNGVLVGVLFAGAWKASSVSSKRRSVRRLASLPEKHSHRAGIPGLLRVFGAGLVAESERICKMDEPPTTRKAAILRFIQLNFSRAVRLADLAKALSLSSSRTGHLVGELFGKSFPAMLTEERMKRAAILLISTDFSVKETAQLVGMPNQYHFNRTFRAYAQCPPGRFRQSRTPGFQR